MKKLSILSFLLLASWIPSLGQSLDTTATYTKVQLQQIATRLAQADLCDSDLAIVNRQLNNEFKIVNDKNDQILDLKNTLVQTNAISSLKDKQISSLSVNVKSLNSRLKWTKAGWIT